MDEEVAADVVVEAVPEVVDVVEGISNLLVVRWEGPSKLKGNVSLGACNQYFRVSLSWVGVFLEFSHGNEGWMPGLE